MQTPAYMAKHGHLLRAPVMRLGTVLGIDKNVTIQDVCSYHLRHAEYPEHIIQQHADADSTLAQAQRGNLHHIFH